MVKTILNRRINSILDTLGFSASALCAVHCAILPLIMTLLPLTSLESLSEPFIEWIILGCSVLLAFTSFLFGYYKHHRSSEPLFIMVAAFIFFVIGHINNEPTIIEIVSTPIGGFIMAYAHYRNYKLCQETNCKICK